MRYSKQLNSNLTKLQFSTVADLSNLIALSSLSSFAYQREPIFYVTPVSPFTPVPSASGTQFTVNSAALLFVIEQNVATEEDKNNNLIQFKTKAENNLKFLLPNKYILSKNSYDEGKNTNFFKILVQDGINSYYLPNTAFYYNLNRNWGAPDRFARASYTFSQYGDEFVYGTFNALSSISLSGSQKTGNTKTFSFIPVTDRSFFTYYNTTSCITVSSSILSCISVPDNNIKCYLQKDENGEASTSVEAPGYVWISEQIVRTPAVKINFPQISDYCALSSLSGQAAYGWYEGVVVIKKLNVLSDSLYNIAISSNSVGSEYIPWFSQTPYVSTINITDDYCLFSWVLALNDFPLGYTDEVSKNLLNPTEKTKNTIVPAYTGVFATKEKYTNPNSFPFLISTQLSGLYYLFYNSASSLNIKLDNFTVPTSYLPIYKDYNDTTIVLSENIPGGIYQKPVDMPVPPASGYFNAVVMSNNNITDVNLISAKCLTNCNLNYNSLSSLNLKNNKLMEILYANYNSITGIDLNYDNYYNLILLSMSGNKLQNLNLNPLVQISEIALPKNNLTNITCLSSYKLNKINLRNNLLQFNELKNIVASLSSFYDKNIEADFSQNPGYNQNIIDLMTSNNAGNSFIVRNQSIYNSGNIACGSIGNGSLGVGYSEGIVTVPIKTNKDLALYAPSQSTTAALSSDGSLFYAGNIYSLKKNIVLSNLVSNTTNVNAVTTVTPGTTTSTSFLNISTLPLNFSSNNIKFNQISMDKNTCYLLSGTQMFAFGKDINLEYVWNTNLDVNLQSLTGEWIYIVSGPNATVALSTNNDAYMRWNSDQTWSSSIPYGVFNSEGSFDAYNINKRFVHTDKLGTLTGAALGSNYCCLLSSNGIIWITGIIADGTDFNFRKDYSGSLQNTLSAQLLNGTLINNLSSKFNKIVGGHNVFFALSGKRVFVHGISDAQNALQKGLFVDSLTQVPSSFNFYTGSDVSVIALSGKKAYATGTQRNGNLGTGGKDASNGWFPLTGEWLDISVGYNHSMALDLSGYIYVAGNNTYGQFGNIGWGNNYNIFAGPFRGYYFDNYPFTKGIQLKKIKCGFLNTFAFSGSNSDILFQTGILNFGGFGNEKHLPLPFTPWNDFAQRVEGSFKDISCFYSSALLLSSTGSLYVAGDNREGQLGLGNNETMYGWTSATITFDKVATGSNHSAGLTGNKVYTTGNNAYGQLGLGDYANRNNWTLTSGSFTDIKCTSNTTFALSTNGVWLAAGYAKNGSIGGFPATENSNVFVPLSSFSNLFTTGGDYLYVQNNNKTYFSGPNGFGQSGTGKGAILKNLLYQVPSFINKNIPLEIDDVACGLTHTVFLSGDRVFACGDNSYGQCGLNDTSKPVVVPTQIPGSYKKIFAGYNVTYLISSFPA